MFSLNVGTLEDHFELFNPHHLLTLVLLGINHGALRVTVLDKAQIAVALWLAGSKLTSPPFSVFDDT